MRVRRNINVYLCQICTVAASRRWDSVCQHRASWHPEAFLRLISNSDSSHARRRVG
jgi:hypothetical protein